MAISFDFFQLSLRAVSEHDSVPSLLSAFETQIDEGVNIVRRSEIETHRKAYRNTQDG